MDYLGRRKGTGDEAFYCQVDQWKRSNTLPKAGTLNREAVLQIESVVQARWSRSYSWVCVVHLFEQIDRRERD